MPTASAAGRLLHGRRAPPRRRRRRARGRRDRRGRRRACDDRHEPPSLAGAGAQAFARRCGFPVAGDLNSERSRALWMEWTRRLSVISIPSTRSRARRRATSEPRHVARGASRSEPFVGHDSLQRADLGRRARRGDDDERPRVEDAGPRRRFADSGRGLYVRADVGAAGSTGRGESNLYSLSSFSIVDLMRRGAHPKDAAMEALRQVVADTVAPPLLNARGQPNFNVKFYVLNARGDYAGAALYGGDDVRLRSAPRTARSCASATRCSTATYAGSEIRVDERGQLLDRRVAERRARRVAVAGDEPRDRAAPRGVVEQHARWPVPSRGRARSRPRSRRRSSIPTPPRRSRRSSTATPDRARTRPARSASTRLR